MQAHTVTVSAATEALGIGKTKFYQLLKQGEIRSFLLGRRRLVLAKDIDSFVKAALITQVR